MNGKREKTGSTQTTQFRKIANRDSETENKMLHSGAYCKESLDQYLPAQAKFSDMISRRKFLRIAAAGAVLPLLPWSTNATNSLPVGSAPKPVSLPWFPNRLYAFVWRNWSLVPAERMAKVVGAKTENIIEIGLSMGLPQQPRITEEQQRRSYITVIRRNWHLLPYEQLLALLGWSEEQLAFTLREDDFLFIKLGSLKPACEPLIYKPPTAAEQERARAIASIVRGEFGKEISEQHEPLFQFVRDLCSPCQSAANEPRPVFSPCFCYSYFALYGDPLMETDIDPYPDNYLVRLAAIGVDGVWLQALLHKLVPFPWDASYSLHWEKRLKNLRSLVARARKHGIGVYLYLNEPRALPLSFFEKNPQLKGVVEGNYAALCTSVPEVQKFITNAVATLCRAVPGLAGLFTITASENLTNCWSHHRGDGCPRCSKRPPAEVIAEFNTLIGDGICQAGSSTRLIVWDWGWHDDWAEAIIQKLPENATLMSVSEWSIPIQRGGINSVVGEYSISTIGPGPRATRHWELARRRGMKTMAKIQANNSWELSAVPYIPAVANVARHAANLRQAKVDGIMLGWTLGGYPSPNLEVVAEIGRGRDPEAAMETVARRRFGETLAPLVVQAWREFSDAFREYPFHASVLYQGPMQVGPANPLWLEPTGYKSTMTGIPYDDLNGWRGMYPPEVFIAQLNKMADGFESALAKLKAAKHKTTPALAAEMRVAEAAAIHFRSAANQARFILAREKHETAELKRVLADEIKLARRLFTIQSRDSRIGFEASNHYFYVPLDLVEKVINCHWLISNIKAV